MFGTGGVDSDGTRNTTWTIAFNTSQASCSSGLPDLPVYSSEGVAARVNDMPVVCGGLDWTWIWPKKCHKFDAPSKSWVYLAEMAEQRAGAMVVQLNEAEFWVLGRKNKWVECSKHMFFSLAT